LYGGRKARRSHLEEKSLKIKWKRGRTGSFLVLKIDWLKET
jgi:hypothetical protein